MMSRSALEFDEIAPRRCGRHKRNGPNDLLPVSRNRGF